MSRLIVLTGKRFGKWFVIKRIPNRPNQGPLWFCRCACGVEKVVDGGSLRSGQSRGCHDCNFGGRKARHGHNVRGKKSSTYMSWRNMISRCRNPKNIGYARYGGRGIQVCDRWRKSFKAFLDDMGVKPLGVTIERIDNEDGYKPSNCRWASYVEQNRNRRDNRLLIYQGETACMTEWAQRVGLRPGTLQARLQLGWSIEKALTTPVRSHKGSVK